MSKKGERAIYEVDDGHRGVRRITPELRDAVRIAKALSLGGTAVIWNNSDPKYMRVYRYGAFVPRSAHA